MIKFSRLKNYPGSVAIVLSVLGYVLVIGTLYGNWFNDIYPRLSLRSVNLLSHAIAVNNVLAVLALCAGWYWIRSDEPQKHKVAMLTGFTLIIVFLVLYLLKTGGGGRKEFLGPNIVRYPYLGMLLVHILLSICSVPLVLYTLVLGLSRPIRDVRTSPHATVGKWAAGCWIFSLVLGLICYLLLNHVYAYEFVRSAAM